MTGGRKNGGGFLDRAAGFAARLEEIASTGSAICLFGIMMIVFADVFMRYFLNSPLSWSYDLVSIYLMGATFFLVLAETLRRNHHVAVDILFLRFSLRWRRICKLASWAGTTVFFAIVLVLTLRTAWQRWDGDNVVAGAVPWPTWIPAAIAALGFGLILLRLVIGSAAMFLALTQGRDLEPSVAGDDVATE